MKTSLMVLMLMLATTIAIADKIASPPPLPKSEPQLFTYLTDIYNNLHQLEVVTSDPTNSRDGKKGDCLLLIKSSKYYLMVNIDSSDTWYGEELKDLTYIIANP